MLVFIQSNRVSASAVLAPKC